MMVLCLGKYYFRTPLESPGNPRRESQPGPEGHRQPKRASEQPREIQREAKTPREAQRSPEKPTEQALRVTEKLGWSVQRGPQSPSEAQRHPPRYTEAQTAPAMPREIGHTRAHTERDPEKPRTT